MSMNFKNALKKSCAEDGKIPGNGNYFASYQHNIFADAMKEEHIRSFEEGDGGELQGKARAVHSSSMIAYNFFYWIDEEHPLVWDSVKYTKVEFERQFTCIEGRKKANMDVVLTSEDEKTLLCLECKFTEPLSCNSFKIADAYREKDKTVEIDWNDIINEYQEDKCKYYHGGIKQNISHLIALNREQKEHPDIQLKFYNLLFVPSEQYKAEHEKIIGYKKKLEEFIGKTKALKAITPTMNVALEGILTYREIYDNLPDIIAPDLKDYLFKRYIQHHL